MDSSYHEKRQSPKRRKEDQAYEILISACTRALRLNQMEHIKDILRFALEKTELVETIENGNKI